MKILRAHRHKEVESRNPLGVLGNMISLEEGRWRVVLECLGSRLYKAAEIYYQMSKLGFTLGGGDGIVLGWLGLKPPSWGLHCRHCHSPLMDGPFEAQRGTVLTSRSHS